MYDDEIARSICSLSGFVPMFIARFFGIGGCSGDGVPCG